MVLSAFLATRREFSASRFSSLAVNSSISLRSVSSRFRSRSVKSFALEVKCVQFSFQPPPVSGLGVQSRDVVLALARHFETRVSQSGDDLGPVPHRSVLDTLEQVVPDQVAGGGFEPEPGPQLRRFDVRAVSGLLHPGTRRIVGPTPAVFVVEGVAEGAEGLLPAGRRDVEAPPGLEVATCGKDVDVRAAATFAVQHGRPGVAVGLQPRPGRLLEGVQHRLDLLVGGLVVRCPRDHAGAVHRRVHPDPTRGPARPNPARYDRSRASGLPLRWRQVAARRDRRPARRLGARPQCGAECERAVGHPAGRRPMAGRGRPAHPPADYRPEYLDRRVVFDLDLPPGTADGPPIDRLALAALRRESGPRFRALIAANSVAWRPGVTWIPHPRNRALWLWSADPANYPILTAADRDRLAYGDAVHAARKRSRRDKDAAWEALPGCTILTKRASRPDGEQGWIIAPDEAAVAIRKRAGK